MKWILRINQSINQNKTKQNKKLTLTHVISLLVYGDCSFDCLFDLVVMLCIVCSLFIILVRIKFLIVLYERETVQMEIIP